MRLSVICRFPLLAEHRQHAAGDGEAAEHVDGGQRDADDSHPADGGLDCSVKRCDEFASHLFRHTKTCPLPATALARWLPPSAGVGETMRSVDARPRQRKRRSTPVRAACDNAGLVANRRVGFAACGQTQLTMTTEKDKQSGRQRETKFPPPPPTLFEVGAPAWRAGRRVRSWVAGEARLGITPAVRRGGRCRRGSV